IRLSVNSGIQSKTSGDSGCTLVPGRLRPHAQSSSRARRITSSNFDATSSSSRGRSSPSCQFPAFFLEWFRFRWACGSWCYCPAATCGLASSRPPEAGASMPLIPLTCRRGHERTRSERRLRRRAVEGPACAAGHCSMAREHYVGVRALATDHRPVVVRRALLRVPHGGLRRAKDAARRLERCDKARGNLAYRFVLAGGHGVYHPRHARRERFEEVPALSVGRGGRGADRIVCPIHLPRSDTGPPLCLVCSGVFPPPRPGVLSGGGTL